MVTGPFLHGFQQRGLGARGRAVDLVRQQECSENRAAHQRELAALQVEYVGPGNVSGH